MDYTKHMARITAKSHQKINDYMHKASRKILDFCIQKDIHVIVTGYQKDWKRDSKLSKKVSQSFAGIPTQHLKEMISLIIFTKTARTGLCRKDGMPFLIPP